MHWHLLWTILFGVIAALWVAEAYDLARGVPSLASIDDVPPIPKEGCPSVSILFAARDEAEKLPHALDTLLSLNYPRYEVIAVDDRSMDATGVILAEAARRDARLKTVRVNSLPVGWLGKPHALRKAYENSTGEWLVFTDADVHFAPDLLQRTIALAKAKGWEHVTLLGRAKMFTLGEKIAMTFFGLALVAGTRPWSANDTRSQGYSGVGAFQMVRRSAYERMGTHQRLAMEVIDDMKLGKLAKETGVRSGAAKAGDAVSVHWHAGVRNMIRGTTKNFFAVSGYRMPVTLLQIFGLLMMFDVPVAALPLAHGWARIFAGIAVALPLVAMAGVAIEFDAPIAYALTFPIGALIFAWMMARSMIVTLWQGGIVWRGTFYPLEELRRGVV
jgi:Glycosyl transferase family 2